jgi:hypothetical protein
VVLVVGRQQASGGARSKAGGGSNARAGGGCASLRTLVCAPEPARLPAMQQGAPAHSPAAAPAGAECRYRTQKGCPTT